ncbi:hypothetical protein M5D96_003623 [Drosophila gunungcola]|uniref:PH domain-containing protein n=1 Tax=Drosophila gunungcola TaxID=103775 RepID=A0A9Q0BSA1_9MUSC|nr:hypothetical protein M5D96_003623 [Drosophila gunungcola]
MLGTKHRNPHVNGSIKSSSSLRSSSKSFQAKMDRMSERLFDVVKSGSMVKRAQNKKRFTPVNYKHRWFELTKRTFCYFDVENVEIPKRADGMTLPSILFLNLGRQPDVFCGWQLQLQPQAK